MKASKLPNTEFKAMVISMFKELNENFNGIKSNMETIKKKKTLKKKKKDSQRSHRQGDFLVLNSLREQSLPITWAIQWRSKRSYLSCRAEVSLE